MEVTKLGERRKVWIVADEFERCNAVGRARAIREETDTHLEASVWADAGYARMAAGLDRGSSLAAPFRAPHHSVSELAMMGRLRGHRWQPGELALAHGGVLFLERASEFSGEVIDAVVKAWSWGWIRLASAPPESVQANCSEWNVLVVPTVFTLVIHTMPCPCGLRGPDHQKCSCTTRDLERFDARTAALTDGAEVIRL